MAKYFSNFEVRAFDLIDKSLRAYIKKFLSERRLKPYDIPPGIFDIFFYTTKDILSLNYNIRVVFYKQSKFLGLKPNSNYETYYFYKYLIATQIAYKLGKSRSELTFTDISNSEQIIINEGFMDNICLYYLFPFRSTRGHYDSSGLWDKSKGLKYLYYYSRTNLVSIFSNGVQYVNEFYTSSEVSPEFSKKYVSANAYDLKVIEKLDLDYDGVRNKLLELEAKRVERLYKKIIKIRRFALIFENYPFNVRLSKIVFNKKDLKFHFTTDPIDDEVKTNLRHELLPLVFEVYYKYSPKSKVLNLGTLVFSLLLNE
jgi:hypothetical protein